MHREHEGPPGPDGALARVATRDRLPGARHLSEGRDADDRPEALLAHQRHRVVNLAEDGRFEPVAGLLDHMPAALQLRRDFVACPPGTAFNELLFRTFRLELWFAALLSAGAVLGRR